MIVKAPQKQTEPIAVEESAFSKEREVSCRVISATVRYLESKGYSTEALLQGLPHSKDYLCDAFNWVSHEVRETVCRRAAELTQNEAVMYQVAVSSPGLNSFGGLEHLVRLLGNPKMAYSNVSKYAALFDHTLKFQTTQIG